MNRFDFKRNLQPSLKSCRYLVLGSLLSLGLSACGDLELPSMATATYGGFASSAELSQYDTPAGRQLAGYALQQASGGTGYCYRYVAQAIHAYVPPFLSGGHAYMAAEQLAASPAFKEISLPAFQLPALPAGAVVVWEQGRSESGHISIADGRGHEISDHRAPQMLAHYGGGAFRVFLPQL